MTSWNNVQDLESFGIGNVKNNFSPGKFVFNYLNYFNYQYLFFFILSLIHESIVSVFNKSLQVKILLIIPTTKCATM